MSDYVFDAGALIALERGDVAMWRTHENVQLRRHRVHVPTTALARVWRGGRPQARLDAALHAYRLASFDGVARAVGVLLGMTRTSDIVDAHVAIVAAQCADVLFTSDPDDLDRLITAYGRRRPMVVHV